MADESTDSGGGHRGMIEGVPIKVSIGEEEESLFVQSSILTKSSDFFWAALKGEWLEGQERVVKLPEQEFDVVASCFHWLYTGSIFSKTPVTDNDPMRQLEYACLAKQYVLGERPIDRDFQKAVIDRIMEIPTETSADDVHFYPVDASVKIIYDNTPASSLSRKLLVDLWSDCGRDAWITEFERDLPHEFLEDLTIALLNRRAGPATADRVVKLRVAGASCTYHVHNDNENCYT